MMETKWDAGNSYQNSPLFHWTLWVPVVWGLNAMYVCIHPYMRVYTYTHIYWIDIHIHLLFISDRDSGIGRPLHLSATTSMTEHSTASGISSRSTQTARNVPRIGGTSSARATPSRGGRMCWDEWSRHPGSDSLNGRLLFKEGHITYARIHEHAHTYMCAHANPPIHPHWGGLDGAGPQNRGQGAVTATCRHSIA